MQSGRLLFFAGCLFACLHGVNLAGAAEPLPLWPEAVPGESEPIGEEHDGTKPEHPRVAGERVQRIANVSRPTLTVFHPPEGRSTGTAVIVCPGGAYQMLAYDLEGTEVCAWLNSLGVTGVLLKYRVPARKGLARHAAALQDAQRAIRITRHRAAAWGIHPDRIGLLGFSAGGHLAAAASTGFESATYPPADAIDQVSARPDFTLLIYPAYMTEKGSGLKLAPEIAAGTRTPPAFLVHTQDDPVTVESSLAYAAALQQARVRYELHIYPYGGHGYGLRKTERPVTEWPERAAAWMRQMGWLQASGTGIGSRQELP